MCWCYADDAQNAQNMMYITALSKLLEYGEMAVTIYWEYK